MEWIKRNIRLVVCFGLLLGACLGACLVYAGTMAVTAGSWGLSFQTEGQPPVGSASRSVLAQYDAAYLGDTGEKVL